MLKNLAVGCRAPSSSTASEKAYSGQFAKGILVLLGSGLASSS
jgi:hypothetical protein